MPLYISHFTHSLSPFPKNSLQTHSRLLSRRITQDSRLSISASDLLYEDLGASSYYPFFVPSTWSDLRSSISALLADDPILIFPDKPKRELTSASSQTTATYSSRSFVDTHCQPNPLKVATDLPLTSIAAKAHRRASIPRQGAASTTVMASTGYVDSEGYWQEPLLTNQTAEGEHHHYPHQFLRSHSLSSSLNSSSTSPHRQLARPPQSLVRSVPSQHRQRSSTRCRHPQGFAAE